MQKKQFVFSVVIPLYNGEKTIAACIESIAAQTYPHYEAIVVNDGSTDGSEEICAALVEAYPFLKYFRQENSGPYHARREGIKAASGDYLLFLDCDDLLRADALEKLHDEIEKKNADIILFNMASDLQYKDSVLEYPFDTGKTYSGEEKGALYETLLRGTRLNNLATKCVRKALMLSVDYPDLPHFRNAEDLYMFVPLLDRAVSVTCVDEPLYYYRTNPHSTTHHYNATYVQSLIRTNTLCLQYAEKWGEKYLPLAEERCCRTSVEIVRYLLSSPLKKDELQSELRKFYSSDFYAMTKKKSVSIPGRKKKLISLFMQSEQDLIRTKLLASARNLLG